MLLNKGGVLLFTIFFSVDVLSGSNGEVGKKCMDWFRKPSPNDGYNTHSRIDSNKLNVHLIPHSHDDPGWLKTIDQYFIGSKNNIQDASVSLILDTVMQELQLDPNRQFVFVEQAFFQRWWHQQSDKMKKITKKLVRNNQLDLSVNGGWCMHDEAAPHYMAMIDQTTYGHQFIKQQFNVTPVIGWQIDPFGHSATQAWLLSNQVGFKGLYFARMHYQEYNFRKANKNLEFMWQPSLSRGKKSKIFTGNIIDHYGPPDSFNFENHDPLNDDTSLSPEDFNICSKIDEFVRISKQRASHTRGNHIFIPMGSDFCYKNARRWFKNMDKLIHYANLEGSVNVLYSNLSFYTDSKLAEKIDWEVKTDDLFPYADGEHTYWSGYFSSRPTLKRYSRVSNSFLQAVKQLEVLSHQNESSVEKLTAAVGLVQHHDGISGTEKQAVSDDYSLRLYKGISAAEKKASRILGGDRDFTFCWLSNVSICNITQSNENFEFAIYNPLPRQRNAYLSIPVASENLKVFDIKSKQRNISFKIFPSSPTNGSKLIASQWTLNVIVDMKPFEISHFRVLKSESEIDDYDAGDKSTDSRSSDQLQLSNEFIRAKFCPRRGTIVSFENLKHHVQANVSNEFLYYRSFQGNGPKSGAYIFRPDSSTTYPVANSSLYNNPSEIADNLTKVIFSHTTGDIQEIQFQIADWVNVTYKLAKGQKYVTIEWTVGSVPMDDKWGKEIILRFKSSLTNSHQEWYTDSNGLEFLRRKRDHRNSFNLNVTEKIAGNYYPITTGVYLRSENAQMSIATDRAQGAASITDGDIEVMLHRRLLFDDARGVGEPLNEVEVSPDGKKRGLEVRGHFRLSIDPLPVAMKNLRETLECEFFRPVVAFDAINKPVKAHAQTFSEQATAFQQDLSCILPRTIALLSLQLLPENRVLLRLGHQFGVNEDPMLSQSVLIDIDKLLIDLKITALKIQQVSLSANQNSIYYNNFEENGNNFVNGKISFDPMDIKTFVIYLKSSDESEFGGKNILRKATRGGIPYYESNGVTKQW